MKSLRGALYADETRGESAAQWEIRRAAGAVGIFGLTGVFLAWFPWTVERLGFRGFGAWLRTWWDEDAR